MLPLAEGLDDGLMRAFLRAGAGQLLVVLAAGLATPWIRAAIVPGPSLQGPNATRAA